MHDRDLYATILGLRYPWGVSDVQPDVKSDEVRVHVRARPDANFVCPECGVPSAKHDHCRRHWRHLDTCQFRTILVAEVPRVDCPEHGVREVHVPWADPGSGFTALFEAAVIDSLLEASISAVARRTDLTWDEVAAIRAVAMDMLEPYIPSTRACETDADRELCFERFHVAKHIGVALARVRREELRQLRAEGELVLNGTGHPWLERHEHTIASRRGEPDRLRVSSLRTARAWTMYEYATTPWRHARHGWAIEAWTRLVSWMRRSRLEPMKRVALTIREHLWSIVKAVVQGVTNAGSESVNAKIQRGTRMACGFRNEQRSRDAFLVHLGGLAPGPACVSATQTDS